VTSLVEVRLDALKQINLTTVMIIKMNKIKIMMKTTTEIKMIKTRIATMIRTATMNRKTTTNTSRLKYLTLNKPLKKSIILRTTASKKNREHFSKWTGLSTTFKSS